MLICNATHGSVGVSRKQSELAGRFSCLLAGIAIASQSEVMHSILQWWQSVGLLEVAHEVALVVDAKLCSDFFDAQERGLQHFLRLADADGFKVLGRRHVHVHLEQVLEPR